MYIRVGKLEHKISKDEDEEVLTTNEVCALFDVSRMTVWKWRTGHSAKARMPHRVMSFGDRNVLVFYRTELDKWAEDNNVMYAEERIVARREHARVRRWKREQMRAHKVERHHERPEPRIRRAERPKRVRRKHHVE